MTRVVAWVLLGTVVVLTGAFFLVTEESSAYRDLRSAVSDGDVDEVTVYGSTAPFRGRLQVEVRWETGPFGAINHVATVTEQHPLRDPLERGRIVVEDVGADLTVLEPGLVVVRHDHVPNRSTTQAYGRPVSFWFMAVCVVVMLWTLLLLITGDPPWRATRWAWFWVMGIVPPVGIVLFLLLGGRTGRWPPERPEQKLTGGWAFLVALVVNSVVQTTLFAITV